MDNGPKMLISLGALLIVIGLVWLVAGKFVRFGHLPGDIAVEKENFRVYFPLGTSILLSVVLSIIFWLIQRFR